jgi:hypothetical protein
MEDGLNESSKLKNNNRGHFNYDLNFNKSNNNSNKEISRFYETYIDENKKIITKLLISLWLFTFIVDIFDNIGIIY